MWAYDDPTLSGTPHSRECHGGAVLLRALHELPAALEHLASVRAQSGEGGGLGGGREKGGSC